MSAFSVQPLIEGRTLPLLLKAEAAGQPLGKALPMLRETIDRHLPDCGGIVFRDFSLDGPDAFRAFAADFGPPLLTYEFGSTPIWLSMPILRDGRSDFGQVKLT